MPTAPTGWPIGSFDTYEQSQGAVEFLAKKDFPVQDLTIVGVNLMLVERVVGKLNWNKVLGSGAASGAWFGLFVGLMLSFFETGTNIFAPIVTGLAIGVLAGIGFSAASYAAARGRRDFQSTSQMVAGRYDVLCLPRSAENGRTLLAQFAMNPKIVP
jgi:hypothetical protein